jgi:hypothetical protein
MIEQKDEMSDHSHERIPAIERKATHMSKIERMIRARVIRELGSGFLN